MSSLGSASAKGKAKAKAALATTPAQASFMSKFLTPAAACSGGASSSEGGAPSAAVLTDPKAANVVSSSAAAAPSANDATVYAKGKAAHNASSSGSSAAGGSPGSADPVVVSPVPPPKLEEQEEDVDNNKQVDELNTTAQAVQAIADESAAAPASPEAADAASEPAPPAASPSSSSSSSGSSASPSAASLASESASPAAAAPAASSSSASSSSSSKSASKTSGAASSSSAKSSKGEALLTDVTALARLLRFMHGLPSCALGDAVKAFLELPPADSSAAAAASSSSSSSKTSPAASAAPSKAVCERTVKAYCENFVAVPAPPAAGAEEGAAAAAPSSSAKGKGGKSSAAPIVKVWKVKEEGWAAAGLEAEPLVAQAVAKPASSKPRARPSKGGAEPAAAAAAAEGEQAPEAAAAAASSEPAAASSSAEAAATGVVDLSDESAAAAAEESSSASAAAPASPAMASAATTVASASPGFNTSSTSSSSSSSSASAKSPAAAAAPAVAVAADPRLPELTSQLTSFVHEALIKCCGYAAPLASAEGDAEMGEGSSSSSSSLSAAPAAISSEPSLHRVLGTFSSAPHVEGLIAAFAKDWEVSLTSWPDAHVPLLAHLVQGSAAPLAVLAEAVASRLTSEDGAALGLPTSLISARIPLLAERKPHGVKAKGVLANDDVTHLDCLWRWEVTHTDHLLIPTAAAAAAAAAEEEDAEEEAEAAPAAGEAAAAAEGAGAGAAAKPRPSSAASKADKAAKVQVAQVKSEHGWLKLYGDRVRALSKLIEALTPPARAPSAKQAAEAQTKLRQAEESYQKACRAVLAEVEKEATAAAKAAAKAAEAAEKARLRAEKKAASAKDKEAAKAAAGGEEDKEAKAKKAPVDKLAKAAVGTKSIFGFFKPVQTATSSAVAAAPAPAPAVITSPASPSSPAVTAAPSEQAPASPASATAAAAGAADASAPVADASAAVAAAAPAAAVKPRSLIGGHTSSALFANPAVAQKLPGGQLAKAKVDRRLTSYARATDSATWAAVDAGLGLEAPSSSSSSSSQELESWLTHWTIRCNQQRRADAEAAAEARRECQAKIMEDVAAAIQSAGGSAFVDLSSDSNHPFSSGGGAGAGAGAGSAPAPSSGDVTGSVPPEVAVKRNGLSRGVATYKTLRLLPADDVLNATAYGASDTRPAYFGTWAASRQRKRTAKIRAEQEAEKEDETEQLRYGGGPPAGAGGANTDGATSEEGPYVSVAGKGRLSARNPFGVDASLFMYEVDSEVDWENEEEGDDVTDLEAGSQGDEEEDDDLEEEGPGHKKTDTGERDAKQYDYSDGWLMDDHEIIYEPDAAAEDGAVADAEGDEVIATAGKRPRESEEEGANKRAKTAAATAAAAGAAACPASAGGCPVPLTGPLASLLYQHGSVFMMGLTYDAATAASQMAAINCNPLTAVTNNRKLAWVMELAAMTVRPLYPPPSPMYSSSAATESAPASPSSSVCTIPSFPYMLSPAPVPADEPESAASGEGAAGGEGAEGAGAQGSSDKADSKEKGAVAGKKCVEDALLPTLVKLTHGSVLGLEKIRAKFRELCPESKASNSQIDAKIREIAVKGRWFGPAGKPEAKPKAAAVAAAADAPAADGSSSSSSAAEGGDVSSSSSSASAAAPVMIVAPTAGSDGPVGEHIELGRFVRAVIFADAPPPVTDLAQPAFTKQRWVVSPDVIAATGNVVALTSDLEATAATLVAYVTAHDLSVIPATAVAKKGGPPPSSLKAAKPVTSASKPVGRPKKVPAAAAASSTSAASSSASAAAAAPAASPAATSSTSPAAAAPSPSGKGLQQATLNLSGYKRKTPERSPSASPSSSSSAAAGEARGSHSSPASATRSKTGSGSAPRIGTSSAGSAAAAILGSGMTSSALAASPARASARSQASAASPVRNAGTNSSSSSSGSGALLDGEVSQTGSVGRAAKRRAALLPVQEASAAAAGEAQK